MTPPSAHDHVTLVEMLYNSQS